MRASIFIFIIPALAAVMPRAEEGSWCTNPIDENFWGQSTAACCGVAGGAFDNDNKACYGLNNDGSSATTFTCCVDTWGSQNSPTEACY